VVTGGEQQHLPPMLPPERLERLNDEQVNGIACLYCAAIASRMMPVQSVRGRLLFCCLPLCERGRELLREQ
jgi:hypothetical protein